MLRKYSVHCCLFLFFFLVLGHTLCANPLDLRGEKGLPTAHHVAGQILVWIKKNKNDQHLRQWVKQRGDTILNHIKEQDFYQIQLKKRSDVLQAIQAYKKQCDVLEAERNYIRKRRN